MTWTNPRLSSGPERKRASYPVTRNVKRRIGVLSL
jgi:hypothetical protein